MWRQITDCEIRCGNSPCFPMRVLACGPHRCCDGQRVAQWDGNSLERLQLLSAFLSPVSVSELGACATVHVQGPQ